jgi:hypothetical protein
LRSPRGRRSWRSRIGCGIFQRRFFGITLVAVPAFLAAFTTLFFTAVAIAAAAATVAIAAVFGTCFARLLGRLWAATGSTGCGAERNQEKIFENRPPSGWATAVAGQGLRSFPA